jgi:hypothetical protein
MTNAIGFFRQSLPFFWTAEVVLRSACQGAHGGRKKIIFRPSEMQKAGQMMNIGG